MIESDYIAEVIETSTTQSFAQCLETKDLSFPIMPPFGSLVKSLDKESGNTILAVVTYATTTSIDSVHHTRALGLSLAELREQQPQIFAMLKTEFKATIVGFKNSFMTQDDSEVYHQYLPPRPPQIHQAVYRCQEKEIINFSKKFDFLRILLQVKEAPVDALIIASIRNIYLLKKSDKNWLVHIGRALGILLKDDYDRLHYILNQVIT